MKIVDVETLRNTNDMCSDMDKFSKILLKAAVDGENPVSIPVFSVPSEDVLQNFRDAGVTVNVVETPVQHDDYGVVDMCIDLVFSW